MYHISAKQLLAARHLLGLSLNDVYALTGISHPTVNKIELESSDPRVSTLKKLQDFYTSRGIEFAPGGWVRLVPDAVSAKIDKEPQP